MVSAHATEAHNPRLSFYESAMLLRGMYNPEYFRERVRPSLARKCDGDVEKVHDLLIETAHRLRGPIRQLGMGYRPPKNLEVNFNGVRLSAPIATAEGLDKNADALDALRLFFPLQQPGTVVVHPRDGNPRVRVAALDVQSEMFNAQGFPSKGIDYFSANLREYRKHGGDGAVFASICGLPDQAKGIETAMQEMYSMMRLLGPYVQGFIWNPASPNTKALEQLRTPETFLQTAQLMDSAAKGKVLLVKMAPYEPADRTAALNLFTSFVDGGGHGAVTTNTKLFMKHELPPQIRDTWGYPSAGRSGTFLTSYMLRSVHDMRVQRPDSVIGATGGIFDAATAIAAFQMGATYVAGYTPYAFNGPGLAREIMGGVSRAIERSRDASLAELQKSVRELARKEDPLGKDLMKKEA